MKVVDRLYTHLLPRIDSWQACKKINNKLRLWQRPVSLVLARHGLPPGRIRTEFPGSSPVFFVGEKARKMMVKFFPPVGMRHWEREYVALESISRRGRPLVPRVIARGSLYDRSTWRYLVMIPVPGTAIRWVWHRLKRSDWQTVIHEAGVMLRQLHLIPAPRKLRGLNTTIMARHTILACKKLRIFSPKLLAELRDRLPTLAVYARRRPHMLLHGDMNETHVAVIRRGGRWHVTGFFDFGNAVAGNPINEWAPYWRSTRSDLEYFRTFARTWPQKLNITPAWRERAAALLLFHSDGPEAIVQACRRLKVNPSQLTWNGLRDLLLPPILDTQDTAGRRRNSLR